MLLSRKRVIAAAGMAWVAAIAIPSIGYPALIAPMSITGVGFAIAIPAITRSVTSTTPPADVGKASGAYATMRQLGGAFGIAIVGAAFAAVGHYYPPEAFSDGSITAFAVAAGLALAGVVAAIALPRRMQHPEQPTPASTPAASTAGVSSER